MSPRGQAESEVFANRLLSVECGRVARENERGWRAHLTDDEDEPAEVVVYCPDCDSREFRDAAQ